MASPPIPSNSVMTEAMITDYMARFGVDRTRAVKDLNDIEEGRGQPAATLPESIYGDVLASFRGRDTQSGGARRLIIGAVAIGTVALATLAAVINGNLQITGTLTVPSINVTSTGASITASGTIAGVDIYASGTFNGVDEILTGFVTSSNQGSLATSTWKINNRTSMVMTGSTATTTINFASLDTCLVMKGSGTTTYVRINNTASLVTSTTPCPTSP